jgi:anti-sigma factor RsiW
LSRVQLKRSVAIAGKAYTPSAEFRAKMMRSISAKPHPKGFWLWKPAVAAAGLLVVLAAVGMYRGQRGAARDRAYGELTDLHVATLASATPVDVISTDRHTVKPWFEGRLPFTFNLPELQVTDFTLIGGRVAYFGQAPGAHLLYRLRKHELSVFIFQDRGSENFPSKAGAEFSFQVNGWKKNGLQFFVVGDVGAEDIESLSKLLQQANN